LLTRTPAVACGVLSSTSVGDTPSFAASAGAVEHAPDTAINAAAQSAKARRRERPAPGQVDISFITATRPT